MFGVAVLDVALVDREDAAIEGALLVNLAVEAAVGLFLKVWAVEQELAAGSAAVTLPLPFLFLLLDIAFAQPHDQHPPYLARTLTAFSFYQPDHIVYVPRAYQRPKPAAGDAPLRAGRRGKIREPRPGYVISLLSHP